MDTRTSLPAAGFGLGLRRQHYRDVVATRPRIDWFEIISENYMEAGGRPRHYLEQVRADYPVTMHGVSLSIGSVDALNYEYLHMLRELAAFIEPARISDHLCWTGVDHTNLHDLLPLPYTEEALYHVVRRVEQVQEFLGRRLLLENVSSYLSYAASEMQEWEFLGEVATRADCHILLDVNNVYVSAHNHGFDAQRYIKALPAARVKQIHLAGHSASGAHLIDTHDANIVDPVWDLYAYTVRRLGPVATMIERDDNIPPLDALVQELDMARTVAAGAASECVA